MLDVIDLISLAIVLPFFYFVPKYLYRMLDASMRDRDTVFIVTAVLTFACWTLVLFLFESALNG